MKPHGRSPHFLRSLPKVGVQFQALVQLTLEEYPRLLHVRKLNHPSAMLLIFRHRDCAAEA
eukprot:1347629-Amorphochlora_amoeboformis.AAC.1